MCDDEPLCKKKNENIGHASYFVLVKYFLKLIFQFSVKDTVIQIFQLVPLHIKIRAFEDNRIFHFKREIFFYVTVKLKQKRSIHFMRIPNFMIVQIQDYKWLQCKIFRHMQDTLQTHKRKFIISVGTFSNIHDCTLINKYIAKVSSI